MEFKKIDGKQYIILGKNEEIYIAKERTSNEKNILIESTNNGLNITCDSSIINSIKGEDILDKVFIPKVMAKEEIIKKCDSWIEMFKKIHDEFKKLVITEKYRDLNITMELSCYEMIPFKGDRVRKIDLALKQFNNTIQEGVSISVRECDLEIYQYLIANVLNYYLEKNYTNLKIDNLDPSWNHILYSNANYRKSCVPIIASLNGLYREHANADLVTSLLGNHNLEISANQIISNLRDRITNKQLSEDFEDTIKHSKKQLKYILSEDKSSN